jgi:hypothetical protein
MLHPFSGAVHCCPTRNRTAVTVLLIARYIHAYMYHAPIIDTNLMLAS